MYRYILLAFVFTVTAFSTNAETKPSAPATYLLEVSSDLNCDALDIELISEQDQKVQYLNFKQSAFAAVDVPAGGYTFGNVSCTRKGKSESYAVLKDKIEPLYLSQGQAYYGGRIIFKKVEMSDKSGAPDVLDNCTREFSRARSESDSQCRDGIGVDTEAGNTQQIAVFAPEVADVDITAVRTALNVSKDQLLYLPLRVSDS